MISKDSFSLEHIRQLQTYSHGDPTLIERTLYAFGLLEAQARTGLPFLFKGGTCLILLLDKPMRLSTDIDIVVPPGTDINEYIAKAAKIFPFSAFEEQIRKGHNRIEKRHFKFQCSPVLKEFPRTTDHEPRTTDQQFSLLININLFNKGDINMYFII